ncbi:hypothetical protein DFH06DRAFT_1184684 [Mycena polygramma]|nr:hypothetical protein DFH06DRAFT_1184684 [Mycena polygramma]
MPVCLYLRPRSSVSPRPPASAEEEARGAGDVFGIPKRLFVDVGGSPLVACSATVHRMLCTSGVQTSVGPLRVSAPCLVVVGPPRTALFFLLISYFSSFSCRSCSSAVSLALPACFRLSAELSVSCGDSAVCADVRHRTRTSQLLLALHFPARSGRTHLTAWGPRGLAVRCYLSWHHSLSILWSTDLLVRYCRLHAYLCYVLVPGAHSPGCVHRVMQRLVTS